MNYNIKGTNIDITPELRDYIDKKLAHAEKFAKGESASHLDIELEYKAEGRSKQYRAEFNFMIGSSVYRVDEWGETMHEAIDIATAELSRELTQEKKKKLHIFRRSAGRVKDYLRGFRSKL